MMGHGPGLAASPLARNNLEVGERKILSFRFPLRTVFQFETATGTLFKSLPLCPLDFATLEIEKNKRPRSSRAFSISAKSDCHGRRWKPRSFMLLSALSGGI
jgi:hypothetical protein